MKIQYAEDYDYKDGDVIVVDDVSITYISYDGDCVDREPQTLTVSTKNNGSSRFLNIKTDKEGFSISDINDLKIIIEDFNKRAGIKNENLSK